MVLVENCNFKNILNLKQKKTEELQQLKLQINSIKKEK